MSKPQDQPETKKKKVAGKKKAAAVVDNKKKKAREPKEKKPVSKGKGMAVSLAKSERVKKVRSAWIIFSTERRAELKNKSPEMDFGEQSRLISKQWKELEDADRLRYESLHQKDQERFEKQMSGLDPSKRRLLRLYWNRRRRQRSDAPKHPLSPYMRFVQHMRNKVVRENPNANFAEVGRLLGATWKAMSESDRRPFVEESEKARTAYLEQRQLYEQKLAAEKEQKKQATTTTA